MLLQLDKIQNFWHRGKSDPPDNSHGVFYSTFFPAGCKSPKPLVSYLTGKRLTMRPAQMTSLTHMLDNGNGKINGNIQVHFLNYNII